MYQFSVILEPKTDFWARQEAGGMGQFRLPFWNLCGLSNSTWQDQT